MCAIIRSLSSCTSINMHQYVIMIYYNILWFYYNYIKYVSIKIQVWQSFGALLWGALCSMCSWVPPSRCHFRPFKRQTSKQDQRKLDENHCNYMHMNIHNFIYVIIHYTFKYTGHCLQLVACPIKSLSQCPKGIQSALIQ